MGCLRGGSMDPSFASPCKINSAGVVHAGGDQTVCSTATAIEEEWPWEQLEAGVQALAANKGPIAGQQNANGG